MEDSRDQIIEQKAPGAGEMDRTWMTSFWEIFTECVIEMDANYTVTNIRKKAGSGTISEDITGKSFPDIAVEKDRAFVISELDRLKTGASQYIRFQFLSTAGRYHRWTLIPFYIDDVFSGCHGVSVDVTDQTLKGITLNWQRAIIEGGSDFVYIADMEGNVLYINPGGFRMSGYDPSSGKLPPERIFTREHLETVNGEGMKCVMRNGFWSGIGQLVRLDGTQIPIEQTMYSVRNEQDEAILIATIIRDITVFQEHEKTLEKARIAAEAANVAKSEFLSRMSHEIRTPMNAILGMINLGLGSGDINRKDYCLTRANNASKHMLGIINDILDMSKIEADKFELSYSVFEFEKALKNITNIANIRAEEKKLEFNVDLAYDVPAFVLGDELRLSQVITNLLTNAIKFTPESGAVTLSVRKTEETDNDIKLQFEITDSGIGISEEQQKKLFTSFSQADSSIARNFGGTGLGLAISKRIIELMGGEIWIESELGAGSKFFFSLKTEKVEGGPRPELYEKVRRVKPRILAVDDSEETREYILHLTEALKLQCDVARDGRQALEMLENSADDPYNLFFIDWQMPEMDGIELTRRIKEIRGDGSAVTMISSHDWSGIEKEAVKAGVDHFLPKPIFPSTLINAINRCIGMEMYEAEAEAQNDMSKRHYDFSGYTILVAEDVDINREIMSAVLWETGVSIEYAENGRIAVDMFREKQEKYDLILMDINMPEMDGYTATEIIRGMGSAKAKDIPIIAMTANVFKEDIEKCMAAGMSDHIGKPIDTVSLFEQLDKYFKT